MVESYPLKIATSDIKS